MIERLANVLYWVSCIIAAIAVAGAIAVLFGTEQWLAVVFGIGALVIYGIGRAIRYVLVGR